MWLMRKKGRTDKVMVNEDCRQNLKTERSLQSFFLKKAPILNETTEGYMQNRCFEH